MNRLPKIVLLIYVAFASFKLANDAYTGIGEKEVALTLLVIGLISTLILLVKDIVQKDPYNNISFATKTVDYVTVFLWVFAILLALNESKLNNSIHQIFEIKRNLAVFEIVNGFIVLIFIAAIVTLGASMFMYGRSRRRYSSRLLVPLACGVLLILALVVPIDKVSVGSCGGTEYTRLSLLSGGKSKIDDARKRREASESARQKYIDAAREKGLNIALGCSSGPRYVLYVF